MKNGTKLTYMLVFLMLLSSVSYGVWIDTSQYRIAISSDGNQHDPDDILASPVAIAMIGECCLHDRYVHHDYSNHIWDEQTWMVDAMYTSVTGAIDRWNMPDAAYEVRIPSELTAAKNNFAAEGNASSSGDRLYYACGGPMEVPYQCVTSVDYAKRQYITVISHSGWNDTHQHDGSHLWTDLIATGVASVHISDQNANLNNPVTQWAWLNNMGGIYSWLYSRRNTTNFDCSDAGMTWYIITGRGDQWGTPAKVEELFKDSAYASCTGGTPPTPDPATFSSAPAAISDTAISMTATTGSDDDPPVYYMFYETSGNPGGSDSGWQTSTSYTDTGLNSGTQYTYRVQMRDSLYSTGTWSNAASATTTGDAPLIFDPVDDAYIQGTAGYNDSTLKVEYGNRVTYMKFNVTGITGTVSSATLEMTEGGDTGNGTLRFYRGSHNDWTESNLAPANAPAKDGQVGVRTGTVGGSQTISVDVTSLVTGNGTYSVVVEMDSGGNDIWFASEETANGPVLHVSAAGGEDTDPPTPNPATWASVPSAISDTAISMTATTGSDASGPVEYMFYEQSGNPGGDNSGWQTSPSYTDTGLDPDTQYLYRVQLRDSATVPNYNTWSSQEAATTLSSDNLLTDPGFETGLLGNWSGGAWGTYSVDGTEQRSGNYCWSVGNLTAAGGIGQRVPLDPYTEYTYSGWVKVDSGSSQTARLGQKEYGVAQTAVYTSSTTYEYLSLNFTTGADPCASAGVVYVWTPVGGMAYCDDMKLVEVGAAPDTDPPTPDPATFAVAPAADSDTAISMTATTGTDASGPVQYNFDETSGNPGGTDSGWQTSASYTDSGLDPDTQYTYTVQMRDAELNYGTASSPASATTTGGGGPPVELDFVPSHDAYLQGSTRFNTNDLRIEYNNRVIYMQFDVSGIPSGYEVTSADIELTESIDTGSGTLRFYRGSHNNWTETNLTTSNAPATDGQVGVRTGTVGDGQTISVEVTPLVTGNGTYSVIVQMDSGGNDIAFGSEESSLDPVLWVNAESSAGGNLLDDPGFESGVITDWNDGWGTRNISSTQQYAGSYCGHFNGGSLSQLRPDLAANTDYILYGMAKRTSGTAQVRMGVKNHGNSETSLGTTSSTYEDLQVDFTTGADPSAAQVYVWCPAGTDGYADEMELVLAP